jgi:hypothetical protein
VKNGYIYKSNLHIQCIPHQNSNDMLHRDSKINPNIHMKTQNTSHSQGNTEQKEECRRYHNNRLQTILREIATKTTWYCHENRQEEQWNTIEDPDMNAHSYAHVIYF